MDTGGFGLFIHLMAHQLIMTYLLAKFGFMTYQPL